MTVLPEILQNPRTRNPEPPKPGLLQRIQNVFQGWFGSKAELEGKGTTETAVQVESPAMFEQQLIQLQYDREQIIQDTRLLMDTDTRMAQSNQEIGRDVVGAGLRITVQAIEGTPDAVVIAAQKEIDRLVRDTDLNGHIPAMVRGLLEDGELYMSPVVSFGRVSRLQLLPTLTMEPQENEHGLFVDVSRAYRQVDVMDRNRALTEFPQWQINRIRYDYRPTRGTGNGRSHYLQARGPGKALQMTETALVVRRHTRAPLRFVHAVGDKERPGTEPEIKSYKQRNGLENPDPRKVITDFFNNGIGGVQALQGDANVDKIDDVKYLDDNYWLKMGKPRGLMGHGENINRDVLDVQKAEYQEFLQGLRNLVWNGDSGVYSGIKALLDFALALVGINPSLLTYQPAWPRKFTKEQLEFIKEIDDRRDSGFISHKTALNLAASTLGIESADAELLMVQEEREQRQSAEARADVAFAGRQTGAGTMKQPPTPLDEFNPAEGVVQ